MSQELPSMDYVAMKVVQPDGNYALAILLSMEAPSMPDECTAGDCSVSPAAPTEIQEVTEEPATSGQVLPGATSDESTAEDCRVSSAAHSEIEEVRDEATLWQAAPGTTPNSTH